MKYEKVHKVYEKGLEQEELDPTLVSDTQYKTCEYI